MGWYELTEQAKTLQRWSAETGLPVLVRAYKQEGATTGRISCKGPNEANPPKSTPSDFYLHMARNAGVDDVITHESILDYVEFQWSERAWGLVDMAPEKGLNIVRGKLLGVVLDIMPLGSGVASRAYLDRDTGIGVPVTYYDNIPDAFEHLRNQFKEIWGMSKIEFTIAEPGTKKVAAYASQKKEVSAVLLLDRLKRLWPLQWDRSTRFGSDTFGFSAMARGIEVGVWFTSPNPTGYVGAHNKQIFGQALGTLLYLMRKEVETLTEAELPAVVDESTLLQRSLWESLKEFLPEGWWKFDEVTRQASRVLSSAPDARLLMYFRFKPDESIELVLCLAMSISTVVEKGVNLFWAVTVHGEGAVSDMAAAINSAVAQMYGLNEEVVAVATP